MRIFSSVQTFVPFSSVQETVEEIQMYLGPTIIYTYAVTDYLL